MTSTTPVCRRTFPLAVFVFLAVTTARAGAAGASPRADPAELLLRLENRIAGPITVSTDGGRSSATIGHVVRPNRGIVHLVMDREFTASDWAVRGSVAATAVNAVHLKVDQRNHACVLTLQPREFLERDTSQAASFMASDGSIYTDIPAGTGPFGGPWSPRVGDPLELVVDGTARRVARDWVPRRGDILQIRIRPPVGGPVGIELENRFGGSVFACYLGGYRSRVAQVLRPVCGVGRFTGTQFADVGEVRANHPGVICVSTSPVGQIGGFQIVPSVHASHRDLEYVRGKPVWLIVGPVGAVQPDLEGRPPLFFGHLRPRLSRVRVRLRGGPWRDMPRAVGLAEGALMGVSHLRIDL